MEPSSERALITSLHQHRLGLTSSPYSPSERRASEMREEMATFSEVGQPTDTGAWPAVALAWRLAMQAQSCAYLALELQQFAEELSTLQIMCPESIYKRLLDSTEIFTRLLDNMRQSYAENNSHEIDNSIPVLSVPLVEAIHSTLDRVPVTTMVESTINTEKASQMHTQDAGDTR